MRLARLEGQRERSIMKSKELSVALSEKVSQNAVNMRVEYAPNTLVQNTHRISRGGPAPGLSPRRLRGSAPQTPSPPVGQGPQGPWGLHTEGGSGGVVAHRGVPHSLHTNADKYLRGCLGTSRLEGNA